MELKEQGFHLKCIKAGFPAQIQYADLLEAETDELAAQVSLARSGQSYLFEVSVGGIRWYTPSAAQVSRLQEEIGVIETLQARSARTLPPPDDRSFVCLHRAKMSSTPCRPLHQRVAC